MWNREADIRFLHRETLDRQQKCPRWDLQAFKYISKLLEFCRVAGRENQENRIRILVPALCVHVRLKRRKRDTKGGRVYAWVSQAIVPENLTRTQDILNAFMQQCSCRNKGSAIKSKAAPLPSDPPASPNSARTACWSCRKLGFYDSVISVKLYHVFHSDRQTDARLEPKRAIWVNCNG